MYRMKPIYRDDELAVAVPDGMYHVKSFHNSSRLENVGQASGEVSDIERSQEDIIQRLVAIKKEVEDLSRESGISLVTSASFSQTNSTSVINNQTGVVNDIVVNADPGKPPLSLFIVLEQLSQRHRVLTTSHVHSSVADINQSLRSVFQNGPKGNRNEYQFAVTLVWKKDELSPSLMVEPHRQTPILGEANIVRYLSRLFMPSYDNGDPLQSTLIDNWIDIATHQLLNGNTKEKAAAVRNLNSRLGNNKWLTASFSLADIVMWSALHQSGQTADSPANVKEWIKSCSNLTEFQSAKSLC